MPWSAKALHELCGLDEPLLYDPTKAYVTMRWVFRHLVKCLVRCNGKGEWRKDTNKGGGGVWVWVPLARSCMCSIGEQVAVGSLTSLNILSDPRGANFWVGTLFGVPSHWVRLGWVKRWRVKKATWWSVNWTTVLAQGPVMVYNPAAEHTYEGPLPDARGTKVHARGANPAIAKISGKKAADGKKEAVEAPSAATNFRTSMAAMQAQGCPTFVEACLFFRASFLFNI